MNESALESAAAGEPVKTSTVKQPLPFLLLAALGIVYGDIGTSPIYALRECFAGKHPIPVTHDNVLGVLSLIFWSLILVISVKYMVFVLRAHNRGEGGIFALLALLSRDQDAADGQGRKRRVLLLIGVFGAAVLYGGVMITPAISVLSAVEGLAVAAPQFGHFVIPITIVILVLLFSFQSFGTAKVGAVFGPLMLVWFGVIAALGITGIAATPEVLLAANPWYALNFFLLNHWTGFFILYAVFLVATGGEALYADLGHFGIKPIRWAWFGLVLPALLLNYFGQGGKLLADPESTLHPFYHLAPDWALWPLIILATLATSVASQAVITGAFSLTRQAVQLGQVPNLEVRQTAADAHGQIYMPAVNWMLMIAAIGLVLGFGSSSNLAAAYGISVSLTMTITTLLAFNVARDWGGWRLWRAGLFLVAFWLIDLTFLGSNVLKIPAGGWFPLVIGLVLFAIMTTWRKGSEVLTKQLESSVKTLETIIGKVEHESPARVPGTGVFFTSDANASPLALQHHLRYTRSLHEQVVIIQVVVEHIPKVDANDRLQVEKLNSGFYKVITRYGFMQGINVPSDLANCQQYGLKIDDLGEVAYYMSRKSSIPGRKKHEIAIWRSRLFAFLARNTGSTPSQYQIPSDQLIEVGIHVGI